MGRQPPPALLVSPDDALQSVRSAMLLGAVLPDMRQDVEALLATFRRSRASARTSRPSAPRCKKTLAALAEDQERLTLLTEQRQQQQAEVEKSLAAERQRAAQLARQADDLRELIARMEAGTRPRGPHGAARRPHPR